MNRMYSAPEAASLADLPETEIRQALHDGRLGAVRFLEEGGELRIEDHELARFIREPAAVERFGRLRRKRILILGEDLLFAGTLKMELKRDPRLDPRYAPWGKDALMLVQHFEADLFVVDVTPSPALPDEVLVAIQGLRAAGAKAELDYFTPSEETLAAHPAIVARLAARAPTAALSKDRGLRAVRILCFEALGLDRPSGMFRQQA